MRNVASLAQSSRTAMQRRSSESREGMAGADNSQFLLVEEEEQGTTGRRGRRKQDRERLVGEGTVLYGGPARIRWPTCMGTSDLNYG